MKDLRLCFIGNGGHAKRIQDVLNELKVSYSVIEHDRSRDLSLQYEVLNSHAIFITSPNDTHFNYLNKLSKHYKGYVYCEKPPINNILDTAVFDLIDANKYFFGFSYRYSKIYNFLLNIGNTYKLGRAVNFNFHISYPFSIKKAYKASWKSDVMKSPFGIIENLSIHYLDFSIMHLGDILKSASYSRNINQCGSVYDTTTIFCLHSNGATSQIFTSYSTSARESMYFSFENGDITYDGEVLSVFYPRNTFDDNNMSIIPPKVYQEKIDSEVMYWQSLCECVSDFISTVLINDTFDNDLVKYAKISTLSMLKINEW